MTATHDELGGVPATEWLHFDGELLDDPTPVASIGLVVMAGDRWIDDEMRAYMPSEGVGLYVNRVPMPPTVSVEAARAQTEDIVRAGAGIVPDDRLDVLAFGTTGGTIAIGEDIVLGLLRQARPDVRHTTPITAAVAALGALGAKRLAVLTPYPKHIHPIIERFLTERGFEIACAGSFHREGDPEFVRVPPQAIEEAACRLAGAASVDAVLISCTALRVSPVLEAIESRTGLPVITSTQALAWHCLRLAGYVEPIESRGSLLRTP